MWYYGTEMILFVVKVKVTSKTTHDRRGMRWHDLSVKIFCRGRRGFTLGQGGIVPPQKKKPEPCPKSLLKVAVCSSKTSKQLYRGVYWRVGVVDLVVLACVLRAKTKKGRKLFVLPPNIFL